MPRVRCAGMFGWTSSFAEVQLGPLWFTGLLASGLKMARRSGEPGPLPCRIIAGAIIGDAAG